MEKKRICHACIGEEFLKAEVRQKGKVAECSYCQKQLKTHSIQDLAIRIEKAFEEHYIRTPDQPHDWQRALLADRESNYEWTRDGDEVKYVIGDAAKIPDEAASDIQEILEEKFSDFELDKIGEEAEFSSTSHYERKQPSDDRWQQDWENFQRSIKTEARFFSRSAAAHLSDIFGALDKTATIDEIPLVIYAGPNTALTSLFRARVFQSEDNLLEALYRPDRHLGPPPAKLAVAGRMNAAGISVFYGATEPEIAIAEVRPPVGGKVVLARFEIVRQLKLLDLSALSGVVEEGSVFDSNYANRIGRATFLRSLSRRLTRPVMPNDEIFEYLPTQAIADFLATENEPLLDGIAFPSVQVSSNGLNVVLFHKAARVELFDIPEESKFKVIACGDPEDDWGKEYTVYQLSQEIKTDKNERIQDSQPSAFLEDESSGPELDIRETALKIDMDSIEMHFIKGVSFDIKSRGVKRIDCSAYESFDDMDFDIPF